MLEKFIRKHLGPQSVTGRALLWSGRELAMAVFVKKPTQSIEEPTSKPGQVGGLSDEQALARFKAFKQNPGLQTELTDLLAHTIKDKGN